MDETQYLPFSPRLSWKHIGEIIFLGDFKITLALSISVSKWFNYTAKWFNYIWGWQTHLNFSPRPLNLFEILKNILEFEEWTNRNQEFSQWTNRKRREPQRNLVDVSPINLISSICFHLNRVGNGNDDISSDDYFDNSKTVSGSYLDQSLVLCSFQTLDNFC